MWILFTLLHTLCLAGVNYIDEYLTRHNSVVLGSNIHERVGGLVLISTLFNFFGVFTLFIFAPPQQVELAKLSVIALSGVAMVGVFLFYFYLLNTYSAHQVVPLFQLVIIWTLVFDFFTGTPLTYLGLIGVVVLAIGAYLVDAGSFRIQVPSRLLLAMGATSFFTGAAALLMKTASASVSPSTLAFYQFLTIALIGTLFAVFLKSYRQGFLHRLRNQRQVFIGFSCLNEFLAQSAYFFGIVAITLVPVLSYYSSLGGLQGLFLLVFLFFFPIQKRNVITLAQWIGAIFIVVGVYTIYIYG